MHIIIRFIYIFYLNYIDKIQLAKILKIYFYNKNIINSVFYCVYMTYEIITPMMMPIIFILFILIGYGTLSLSRHYKLPEPLLLFILGLIAQIVIEDINIKPYLVFALVILLFDAGTHFIPRKFDAHSAILIKFIAKSIAVNSIIIGIFLHSILFDSITATTILLSVFVGSALTACSQFEVLKVFKIKKSRLYYLTELEDHLSNPIAMIIMISVMTLILNIEKAPLLSALKSTIISIFFDVGIGLFLGLITLYAVVKIAKRRFFVLTSMVLAFLTYFVAVVFNGGGFIAVIIASIFYHNVTTKVPDMGEFTPLLSNLVYVFTFILMGYMVNISKIWALLACFVFIIYVLTRYILLHFSIRHTHLFMALDCPKGLLAGAVTLLGMIIFTDYYSRGILSMLIFVYIFCITLSYMLNLSTKDIVE